MHSLVLTQKTESNLILDPAKRDMGAQSEKGEIRKPHASQELERTESPRGAS